MVFVEDLCALSLSSRLRQKKNPTNVQIVRCGLHNDLALYTLEIKVYGNLINVVVVIIARYCSGYDFKDESTVDNSE